ncbi:MAG: class I adenylate-forming enzyme family protein, partial [Actinomycetota bacterium]
MSVLNVGRLLRRTQLYADQPAVTDLGTGWRATYGEHLARVAATVAGLRSIGIESTDRVAILAGSTHQYVELWHAGLAGGFIICPLNNRFTLDELVAVTADAGCVALIHDDEHAELANAIAARAASVERRIPLDGASHGGGAGSTTGLETLIGQAMGAELPPEPAESAPAALIYTGGTTGRPKGVLHRQRSIVAQIMRIQMTCSAEPDHALLSIMPMFHIGSIAAWGWFWPSGGHSYLLPAFEPGEVLRAVSEHSITVLPGVPTMFAMLLDHPDFEPELVSSLQMAFYGAAPMWPELLARLLDVNPDLRFFQAYGTTETGGGVTMLRPEFHTIDDVSRLGSVGRPDLDVE